MNWPWPPPRRGEIASIVVIAVIIAAVCFIWVKYPRMSWMVGTAGFGPDWDCTRPGQGDPVCIKKPPSPGTPSN